MLPLTTVSVPTLFHVMHPYIPNSWLVSVVRQEWCMHAGNHSSPASPNINSQTIVLSQNNFTLIREITSDQLWSTVHRRLLLAHTTRIFLFRSRILIFFLHTRRWYLFFDRKRWIDFSDTGTCLPSLNCAVISFNREVRLGFTSRNKWRSSSSYVHFFGRLDF